MTVEKPRRLSKVDWNEIATKGADAFTRFISLLEGAGESDNRIENMLLNYARLSASYTYRAMPMDDTTEANPLKVKVRAYMNDFHSSGHVILTGSHHWVFAVAEDIMGQAGEHATHYLVEAGLEPFPERGLNNEGRDSFWEVIWKIYPSNHPKVLSKEVGH